MNRNESFNNITDMDLYLETDPDSPADHQLQFSNISWASLVEEELGQSLEIEEKSLSGSTDQLPETPLSVSKDSTSSGLKSPTSKEPAPLSLAEILTSDLKKFTDHELLKHQSTVTNSLRKEVHHHLDRKLKDEKSRFDKKEFMSRLNWLSHSAEFLSRKIGLPVHPQKERPMVTTSARVIPRSSYQFCSYRHECEFNYNHSKHQGCFAQHFVHNLVYEDLNVLIGYLNSTPELDGIDFTQIKKCIDTISFVVNHMATELSNLMYFNTTDISILHRDRTPSGKKNRRRGRRRPTKKTPQTVKYR